ncbi:MobA/MobL family protein [Shimia sp. R11_0]|uniref:MobA/MobL family protein n=1 Tax=Shimia sp. R11_0 TaxID=2821096 RepID=UPI001ADB4A4E|nr:MobA/MobL family protein [Shimia sp. R11_0]MBO9479749.1 MobA/MobL family protein [Shimia sp. R11_0]
MAIYSLNHKAIGKASQDKPFTSAAHIRYITRNNACREILSDRMPNDPQKAQRWMRKEEAEDRKNARVCDKVMIALPKELSAEERTELVKDFAQRVTQGQAPWFAAIHDRGKDRKNPHCHLVFRDRDKKGKRCLYMSAGKSERALLEEKGIDVMTTKRMRVMWEKAANEHLERCGHRERIDHRSLADQGLEREATIHEGPKLRKMLARGVRPESKEVQIGNQPTAKTDNRTVDFSVIDEGKTRQDRNREIVRDAAMSRLRDRRKSEEIDRLSFRDRDFGRDDDRERGR